MGKPFGKELEAINSVLEWSSNINTKDLSDFLFNSQRPSLIVGSGGSISAAHLLANLLRLKGKIGQVLTPLELFYTNEFIYDEQIFLLSASGRNKDIRFGLRTAISSEPDTIGCLTMTSSNPLLNEARKYSICTPFGFDIPTGKDGFLATNSLIATWSILLSAFGQQPAQLLDTFPTSSIISGLIPFLASIDHLRTLIVLYGKWGQPVAIDIESKCTEAALVNAQIADFRNFGHGRHHWIAKHPTDTAVIALISPGDRALCEATLGILPANVPKFLLESKLEEPLSSLDLLIQSFYLIKELGRKVGIDPGKPGVPEFGSKLYHINPATKLKIPVYKNVELAIRRKARRISPKGVDTNKIYESLYAAHSTFINVLKTATFSILVADYDGTLCDKERRFSDLSETVVSKLTSHLENGFIIGVATGRGRSVQYTLRKAIPPAFWKQMLIGYYNGTVILPLSADLPPMNEVDEPILKELEAYLRESPFSYLPIDSRKYQLTITTNNEPTNQAIITSINAYLQLLSKTNVTVLTSGSSIDVIVNGSKVDVIKACQQLAIDRQLTENCLCIGDQGKYPGNDFSLLATPFSLSVDEVSTDPKTCWNLAGLGIRNEQAFIEYMDRIKYHSHFFNIDFTA